MDVADSRFSKANGSGSESILTVKALGFDIPPLWRGHRRAFLSSSVVRSFAPGTKI